MTDSDGDFQTRQIRFTVFMSNEAELPLDGWWREVAGVAFERRIDDPPKGRVLFRGALPDRDDVVLTLASQASLGVRRIDWLFGPPQPTAIDAAVSPSIGPADAAFEFATAVMRRWVAPPDCARLAVGAMTADVRESRELATNQLRRLLPYAPTEEESDIQFRTNIPASFALGERRLIINRLMTCSLDEIVTLEVGGNVGISSPTATFNPPGGISTLRYEARIEVDMNTKPGDEIASTEVMPLLMHLAEQARLRLASGYDGFGNGESDG